MARALTGQALSASLTGTTQLGRCRMRFHGKKFEGSVAPAVALSLLALAGCSGDGATTGNEEGGGAGVGTAGASAGNGGVAGASTGGAAGGAGSGVAGA